MPDAIVGQRRLRVVIVPTPPSAWEVTNTCTSDQVSGKQLCREDLDKV